MQNGNGFNECKNSLEIKQAFLSSAISDIENNIQLMDTKVSIIMGAIVATMVGFFACYESIIEVLSKYQLCAFSRICIIALLLLYIVSTALVFYYGLTTIRIHSSNLKYDSKWFLSKDTADYTFFQYSKDISNMSDEDIIENMTAELYKLNDIRRQKLKTTGRALFWFATSYISVSIFIITLVLSVM